MNLAAGDTFKYNKPLDLTGKTEADTIVSFYITPEINGIADVRDVKVRLTDIYDENNFIEIVVFDNCTVENNGGAVATYSGARYSGYDNYVGYKNWGSSDIYYNVRYQSEGGYASYGQSFITDDGEPFKFSVNYAAKAVYGNGIDGSGNAYLSHCIADFDDSDYFGSPWGGFTTGEAYLTIYSDMYSKSTFGFTITEILDEDLSEKYYDIVENTSTYAVFNEEPVLPVYLVKNSTYAPPTLYGTKYVNGETDNDNVAATIQYKFDDGALNAYGGGNITVNANNKLTLVYSLSFGITKTYVIPVITTGVSFR